MCEAVISAGSRKPAACQLLQREQRVVVEVVDTLGLVGNVERLLPARVLGRHSGRTVAGVAGLRLDAAEREDEAARRVAPRSMNRIPGERARDEADQAQRPRRVADREVLVEPRHPDEQASPWREVARW
jgi:hypothetical protein